MSKVVASQTLTFVVTGSFSRPRKHFEKAIKEAGHKVSSYVSKNTDYLVVGEKAGSQLPLPEGRGL